MEFTKVTAGHYRAHTPEGKQVDIMRVGTGRTWEIRVAGSGSKPRFTTYKAAREWAQVLDTPAPVEESRPAEEPLTVDACMDCVYFIEYGRLDDLTMDANPGAGREHAAKIEDVWGDTARFTGNCGRDCDDHGLTAYDGDEDAYRAALETRDTETWFSFSVCDVCGTRDGGGRQHATVWLKS